MADLTIRELAVKVDDLSRVVAGQSGALGRLADAGSRPGTDLALLVDLHALRGEAVTAAGATRSARERGAFEAIATGLERLLAGRGGVLVVPRAGHPFSAVTMEAVEEVACPDAALDRTVAALLVPGLEADGRTVRPARVTVHRFAPRPVTADPGDAPEPAPEPPAAPAEDEPPAPERNGQAPATGRSRARRRTTDPEPKAPRTPRPARRAQQPTPPERVPAQTGEEPAPAGKEPARRAGRKRAQPAPPAAEDQPQRPTGTTTR